MTFFFQVFLPTFSITPFFTIMQTAVCADLLFEYNGVNCSIPNTSGRFENLSAKVEDLSLTLFSSALLSHVVKSLLPQYFMEANMSQSPMSLANSLSSYVTTSFPVFLNSSYCMHTILGNVYLII